MKTLLIIDVQQGLVNRNGLYNKNLFLETLNRSIAFYHQSNWLVIMFRHNNKMLKAGTENWRIDPYLHKSKDDIIIDKHHGNVFKNTELKEILHRQKVKEVLVCGLASHGCVKASCFAAVKNGYNTYLLKNGHTSWNQNAEEKNKQTEHELQAAGVHLKTL